MVNGEALVQRRCTDEVQERNTHHPGAYLQLQQKYQDVEYETRGRSLD